MLLKCIIIAVEASSLVDPYCIVESSVGQAQPQLQRAAYCEITKDDTILSLRLEERIPMSNSGSAIGCLEIESLVLGGEEEILKVQVIRQNKPLGFVRVVVRKCYSLDCVQMILKSIQLFRSSRSQQPKRSRLAGFYIRVRVGDYEAKRNARAKRWDLQYGYQMMQSFDITGSELGQPLELFIEEVKDLPLTAKLSIISSPLTLPASGRYFCVDREANIQFAIELQFSWIPSPDNSAPAMSIINPEAIRSVDAPNFLMPLAPETPRPETDENASTVQQGERDQAQDNRNRVNDNYEVSNKHEKCRRCQHHRKYRKHCDDELRSAHKKELKSLRRQLEMERERSKSLQKEVQRQSKSSASLDSKLYQLQEENRQLTKTIRYLRPHWDTLEYRSGEYGQEYEKNSIASTNVPPQILSKEGNEKRFEQNHKETIKNSPQVEKANIGRQDSCYLM